MGNVFGLNCVSEKALRVRGVLSCANAVLITVANIDGSVSIAQVDGSFPPLKREPGFASVAIYRRQIGRCCGVPRSCGPPVPTYGFCDVPLSTLLLRYRHNPGNPQRFHHRSRLPAVIDETHTVRCALLQNPAVCLTDSVINGNRQLSHRWSVSRGYALPQACNNAIPVWLPCLSHYRTLSSRFITAWELFRLPPVSLHCSANVRYVAVNSVLPFTLSGRSWSIAISGRFQARVLRGKLSTTNLRCGPTYSPT